MYQNVKYRILDKEEKGKDGKIYISLQYRTKKVKSSSVKRYMNCEHKLIKLSKCAGSYLRYITEKMDDANTIHHTQMFKAEFNLHMQRSCQKEYKDQTLRSALTELVKQGLLIKYADKIDYTVNPLYFTKGNISKNERSSLIRQLLEKAVKTPKNSKSNIKKAMDIGQKKKKKKN